MEKIELHEKFIHALIERSQKRPLLVAQIADILRIERDSANRRLTGKVQFSIREMGILAQAMGISIDALIYDETPSFAELLIMESPGLRKFPEATIIDTVRQYTDAWKEVSEAPQSEYGAVISSLPIEVYVHYPTLLKLNCFKWAHYIYNSKKTFKEFELPEEIANLSAGTKENFKTMNYMFYIWDYSVIFSIICDVRYFRSMDLIDREEVNMIKAELVEMLDRFEKLLIADENPKAGSRGVEHYVSSVETEVSATYMCSKEHFHSCIFTFFMRSATYYDKSKCLKMRDWVHSMKKVSTLISGSGEMARVNFFRRQYLYVESLKD